MEPEQSEPNAEQVQGAEAATEQQDAGTQTDPAALLAAAEDQAQENWDLYLRASAELENMRRRAERDLAQALRYGPERLVRELLPALDGLSLALAEHAAADDPARAGLEMIERQFMQALANVGVETLDPTGAAFDPELHEAISIQETADAAPDTILMVVQRGFVLNERLIRPARVVVARAPEASA